MKIIHFGSRYYCNCCGSRVRRLKPGGSTEPVIQELRISGAGYRPADYCPVCKATSRDRLVWLCLEGLVKTIPSPHILHIAPEQQLSRLLRKIPGSTYRCGDLDPARYQYYAPAEYIDLCAVPYPDRSFDLVVCNHVLEHIPDDLQAMRELYRVLKTGGKAVLQVPVSQVLDKTFEDPSVRDASQRQKIYGQKDHVRVYGNDYPDRLRKAGFEVMILPSSGLQLDGLLKKIFLDDTELVFIGSRA